MIGLVTLISVVAGALTGFLAHDASLGIAASGGLATVLSCVEVSSYVAVLVVGMHASGIPNLLCDRYLFLSLRYVGM